MKEIKETIKGADFSAKVAHNSGVMSLNFDNGFRCEVEAAECGRFSENTALTRKVRQHRTDDQMEISVDLQRVIPFGQEFDLKRKLVFGDGFVRVTVDASACRGGKLEHLALDPVTFYGSWSSFGVTTDNESIEWLEATEELTTIYDSEKPLLRIVAESTSGALFESGCGEDLWRHEVAQSMVGCSSMFTVEASKTQIVIKRTIIDFIQDEEVEIPRRPLRLSYYIAWALNCDTSSPQGEVVTAIDQLDIPATGVCTTESGELKTMACIASPVTRRRIRDMVRSSQNSLKISGIELSTCYAPAHLERPGKKGLKHWDIAELLALYQWGNRQKCKSEQSLTFGLAEKSAVATLVNRPARKFNK